MKRNLIVCCAILIVVTACGGGSGGGSGGSSSNINTNPLVLDSPNNSNAAVDPALVSQTDSSQTLQAVRAGVNLETTVISARFVCFDEQQNNVEFSILNLDVNGLSVTATDANGQFPLTIRADEGRGEVSFIGNDSKVMEANLKLTDHGQVIELFSGDYAIEGCYQEGAALEAALHRYNLNTPKSGIFTCSDNGTPIELLDGNAYRVGDQTGQYQLGGITFGNYSVLDFLSGTAQGARARYSENSMTGLQLIQFEPSEDSQLTCSRLDTPKPFKLYGPANAPAPVAPSVALQGTYFMDTSVATTVSRNDSADYVEFTPSGYLRFGLPAINGNRCDLTSPSGLPFCEQYQFDGRNLSIIKPWGETVQLATALNNNGTLQSLDGTAVELLAPVNPSAILGVWQSQFVNISSSAGCIVDTCSTTVITSTFTFDANGQFRFTFEGDSKSSFNSGFVSVSSGNSDASESNGTYRVIDNTLELSFSNGQIDKRVIHLTQYGWLAIGDVQYSR